MIRTAWKQVDYWKWCKYKRPGYRWLVTNGATFLYASTAFIVIRID